MQTIETTVGQATAELQKRGINSAVAVTVTVSPISQLLWKARAEDVPTLLPPVYPTTTSTP